MTSSSSSYFTSIHTLHWPACPMSGSLGRLRAGVNCCICRSVRRIRGRNTTRCPVQSCNNTQKTSQFITHFIMASWMSSPSAHDITLHPIAHLPASSPMPSRSGGRLRGGMLTDLFGLCTRHCCRCSGRISCHDHWWCRWSRRGKGWWSTVWTRVREGLCVCVCVCVCKQHEWQFITIFYTQCTRYDQYTLNTTYTKQYNTIQYKYKYHTMQIACISGCPYLVLDGAFVGDAEGLLVG